jgi:GPH family glycoside/pentoside/hexuronide:cation symporter
MDLTQFGLTLLAIQFSSFVWLMIWARVSERIGKHAVYYLGIAGLLVVLAGLFLLQPGQVGLVFALAVGAGVGVSVIYLVPWSMLPDVVELDELKTGQRREGIFYGFFALMQKLALALAVFVSGWVLDLAGYINTAPGEPPPVQPDSVLLALRVLEAPVGAAILLLSLGVVYLYPITKSRHAEIRAELRARGLPE